MTTAGFDLPRSQCRPAGDPMIDRLYEADTPLIIRQGGKNIIKNKNNTCTRKYYDELNI